MSDIFRPEPWYGEFGWEVMTWAPYLRFLAKEYEHAVVTSFKGMDALYIDFAEFQAHDQRDRLLKYPKRYRLKDEAIYYNYGTPGPNVYDIVIHARDISRKSSINYRQWNSVIQGLQGFRIACVGSYQDYFVPSTTDERGINLQSLMNIIAGAKVLVGVSSGVMHLGAMCGTNLVVWGDDRTYYGETLEKRYNETWNPFKVRVEYIYGWHPKPMDIIEKVGLIWQQR